ncbi:MAG: RelA/SpoT domain-containing protein [Burkholderia gladioli]
MLLLEAINIGEDEREDDGMAWARPEYSRGAVDRAGKIVAGQAFDLYGDTDAIEIVDNWRASHSFPLNAFQIDLRRQAKRVNSDAIVAQRLKRVPSIIHKISRYPSMSLSRMQDIGGCRAILESMREVLTLQSHYADAKFDHDLVTSKNYIDNPKQSGYRGIHLVYQYRGAQRPEYDGLKIEIQIRSRMQHAWATAVETTSAMLGQTLKSSEGEQDWLDFFAWTSSAFSLMEETTPLHQGMTWVHIFTMASLMAKDLGVVGRLRNMALSA